MDNKLRIGSLELANNLILAPMAGITNLPMRIIARQCGAALAFTEMVSVNGLVRDGRKSFELMRSCDDDRPLGVQLFGEDATIIAEAARMAEPYADIIDVNMGCPVKKVVGTGAGSALLRDTEKIRKIIHHVRKATKLPLTVKIRSGWNPGEKTYLEVGKIAEAEGCDAIILHARSRAQMFEGHADWDQIAALKQSISIPVIGNGDIFSAQDAVALLNKTACDGVMIARGGLGNPWIFRQALELLHGEDSAPPTAMERFSIAIGHMESYIKMAGEKAAVREMRKHLSWYTHGMPQAAKFRSQINTLETEREMTEALHAFFGDRKAA